VTYLDWAASAPPDPGALDAAREVSASVFANPSSPHAAGRAAAEALGAARARFAGALGVDPGEVIFTSGGTEANVSVLLSLLDRHRLGGVDRQVIRVVTTGIEHSSIFEQAKSLQRHGVTVTFVPPGPDGRVSPAALADALDNDVHIVSAMLVNNETGAIQDVKGMVRAVRERSAGHGRRILFHTDAVQALGKVPFSLRDLGVDAASFSGHKFGAPRGIGALYVRTGASPGFLPVGGGQESGRRPGTENVAGAAAMAAAAEARARGQAAERAAAEGLMQVLVDGIRALRGGWILPPAREARDPGWSPFILLAGFPPLPGEVVVRTMDAKGFCISMGSACSTVKKDRTRVPLAMGLSEETALSTIRISLGHATARADIDSFLETLGREIPPLLSIAKGRGA
jgi:cysteine desulfurase